MNNEGKRIKNKENHEMIDLLLQRQGQTLQVAPQYCGAT